MKKHLDKDDTLKVTFDLAEKSSCSYSTTARRFSQERKYSFGNTKVVNCLPRKEIKPPFCGKSSSSSRFVVEWLPSDEKSCSSLESIRSRKMLSHKGVDDCRIADKTSCKKCRNSFEFADSSSIKRQEIFPRFCEEDKSRYHASDRFGNVDSMNDQEKEIVSLNKPDFRLKGFTKSISDKGMIFQDERREQKLLFDKRHQEKKLKVSLLKNEEDYFRFTNENYSLDYKTLLNYNPSCLYSSRVLESKRAIPGTNMAMNKCPARMSTESRKIFPRFSNGSEKSKKPVSLPSKPVKPVRLKLKHRQDKFMNERKETPGLKDEEGRILPITLWAWKKNSYSVMTPYMAKVVWSVMEDELKC